MTNNILICQSCAKEPSFSPAARSADCSAVVHSAAAILPPTLLGIVFRDGQDTLDFFTKVSFFCFFMMFVGFMDMVIERYVGC